MKFRMTQFLWLSVSTTALWAASFDCVKAQSPLERAICADPALDAADDELNAAWKAASKAFPLPGFLRTSQQLWLKDTALCTKLEAGTCLNAFRSRTALLKNLGGAKVYTKYGKKFSLEAVTIVVFDKGTEKSLWMYGGWMSDMFDPQPPPFGFLLDDVSGLKEKGDGRYEIEGRDHEVVLSEDRVVFEESILINARQGYVEGIFNRIR